MVLERAQHFKFFLTKLNLISEIEKKNLNGKKY